ncbi:MAG: DUF1398 domain-containing protein [Saprospiraceae bacterium]|nr:DUF1398 domain-containing protein [Saprospiraceae bacterium]MBK7790972.1 DUF1398 domain-containing protein [Saprospiraceae bacterium]MBK8111564.1 DUF1398 domain-containing protein [Saprospiraceae bacterium]MBK8848672.1 DUF1398 domain-containing protein [Saprospiraceae bacterium]MBK9688585.1 DUF1398 domain-containing protein [Saprospiraceae bacterium]
MFTADLIKAAHSKVKSGADFPSYITEIKGMGVTHYEAYVSDGHIEYHGTNQHTAIVPAKYEAIPIANTVQWQNFTTELKAHQQGKTDYLTFIHMCAASGIDRWQICMDKMTCTYFDKVGNEVLVEEIPLSI